MATKLRVRIRRVASDTDDCFVRRAVVERLTAYGRWIVVEANDDPSAADDRDREAARRAAAWAQRPADGYAAYIPGHGCVWVEPFAAGERWTQI